MAEFIEDNDDSTGESELDIVEQIVKPEPKVEDDHPTNIPDKYKGKGIEDVIKMHQEAEKLIGKQAQEVGEVRKLADELLKQSLSKPTQPTEVEPEIDFFEDPKKAVKQTLESHPDVLAAKQAAQEFKRMQIQQRLSSEHPDFQQVVQDPEFAEWVKQSPVRLSLYTKADSEFDFDSANELLSTYKALKQVKQQAEVKQAKQATENTLKSATVDTGGTGESSKRVYRRADLIRLRMTDPDRYNALEHEIMAAYAEGRVK
jgi:hypothetical protein